MPDYSSDLFFLQTTILTLIGPLFTILNSAQSTWGQVRPRQTLPQRVPLSFFTFSGKHTKPDVPKGSPFGFFSELCDFFSKIFFSKNFFFENKTECLLINPEGSPLLHFSALCDFFWKKFFFQKFQFFSKKSVLRFLSLRYGAEFRRSRLVYNKDNCQGC